MSSKIIIATAQTKVSRNIKENGQAIRYLIKKSHSKGADIIHFCEGALSGYTKKQLGSPENIDFQKIRIELEKILKLAKSLNVWVVLGCIHELSQGNRPHNSLYIISNKGEIVNRYDKRKCSHNELLNWYTPGFEKCTFEIKGIKFECLLCIEIQFPELFTEAEKNNVHCILFSSYSRNKMFGIQAQGYAASNNYWISMAIPVNESDDLASQFILPNGIIGAKCTRKKSSIIINEIDLQNSKLNLPLNLARPWRKLAREGAIYESKRVVDNRSKSKTIM